MLFMTTLPAASIWRRDLEHRPERRGLSAPGLAATAATQEKALFPNWHATLSGWPWELLDFLAITRACGPACSRDGLHFGRDANRAALAVAVNIWVQRHAGEDLIEHCDPQPDANATAS
jgi:hypothetical protein